MPPRRFGIRSAPMSNSRSARLRAAARALRYAVLAALVACVSFLPFAGRYLVVEQPLVKSDAIVVLAGSRVDRWMESVDLYREGWAPRVVISPGRVSGLEVQLRAKGIPFPAETDLARDAMVRLGMPREAILVLAGTVDNTAEEAAAARQLAVRSGWRRIIVVTAPYHTRRAGFAFARAFAGTGVEVILRGMRAEVISPNTWWRHRADVRWVTSELTKLVAYRLGLGP